ncbi:hypothetical protein BGZ65_002020 [Modicella reniformis]|uniref:ATP-dependent DNA helicase n=1 Tax=Modicella reniformis TaxID=1440133 RepID=A0A9P6M9W1_9FUNG|nr:hypothetical protein BGZ65_002020 [Modicella reniformis]
MSPPGNDEFDFDDLDVWELDHEEQALLAGEDDTKNSWSARVGSKTINTNGPGSSSNGQRSTTQSKAPTSTLDGFDEFGDLDDLSAATLLLDDHDLSGEVAPPVPVRFSTNLPNQRPPQQHPQQQQQQQQQQHQQPAKFYSIFSSAKIQSSNNIDNPALQRTTSFAAVRNTNHSGLTRNHSNPNISSFQNNRFQGQGSHSSISSYFVTKESVDPADSSGAPQQTSLFTTRQAHGLITPATSNIIPRSDPLNDFTADIFQSPETATQPPQLSTHHFIDKRATLTWQYPINYPKRDYQYNIIRRALFTNTLVSLPTGLGKTFIAAVVMLNYYRWFPKSKIIFMAPTRPLVNQQIEACFNVCGIPQEDTVELTGQQAAELRKEEWRKRVVFCTPQVLQNDLKSGFCPAEDIVCLVVDEAHRATGRYAYSEVIRLLEPVNRDVRVMALTATPGSDIKTVQQVVQNLKIAKIELRTEDSMDLQQYVFQRSVQEMVVPCGREVGEIRDKFQRIMRPFLERLSKLNIIRTADPGQLSRFAILQGKDIFLREHAQSANRAFVMKQVAICMGIVHAYELLTVHGIRSFFGNMDPFSSYKGTNDASMDVQGGSAGSKRKKQGMDGEYDKDDDSRHSLALKAMEEIPDFMRMMDSIRIKLKQPDFVSHPKMERLVGVVVQHFMDRQDENDALVQARADSMMSSSTAAADGEPLPQTRVMIFANYRETVEEITRVLEQHRPLIKVQSFIGQATSKGKKGISQKEQQRVVANFQKGEHNVLVATSIGEEGLDIGDVDLIVCYDSHASPIRMLQRMGRTGRKRKGKICVLLAEGHEEQKYRRSLSSHKTVLRAIAQGTNIQYYAHSPRILPPGPPPTCDLVHINVPTFVAASTGRKRRKLADGNVGTGTKINASALLDAQEFAQFQLKIVSGNNKRSVVTPDTIFHIGHSTRTMDFVSIVNQVAKSRLEQSLSEASGPSAEKDPYSKRMSELIDRWGRAGTGSNDSDSDVVSKSRTTELSRRAKGGDLRALKQNLQGSRDDVLSDGEMEVLNTQYSLNSLYHVSTHKRRLLSDDDSDDNDRDKDSSHKSSESSRTNQPSSVPKRTYTTSNTSKNPAKLPGSSRTTGARSTTAATASTKSIRAYFRTLSDDEIDKEIMNGLGQEFGHKDIDGIPDSFPGRKTSVSVWSASDTEFVDGTGNNSARVQRGFDFKEPLTPPPLWYKPKDVRDKGDPTYSADTSALMEGNELFPVFELPPVPEPGQWYRPNPVVLPIRGPPEHRAGSTRDPETNNNDKGGPIKDKEEAVEHILWIESSQEDPELDQERANGSTTVLKTKDTSAYQSNSLPSINTSSFTRKHQATMNSSGFISAKSLMSSKAKTMDGNGSSSSSSSSIKGNCQGEAGSTEAVGVKFNKAARGSLLPPGNRYQGQDQGQSSHVDHMQLWGSNAKDKMISNLTICCCRMEICSRKTTFHGSS